MASFDLRALQLWLRSFDVALSEAQLDQSRLHLETLLLWSRRMNLVSQTRPEEILIKHFADSFVAASLIADSERVADLGSGGGFPAIPMAIVRPESSFALVEGNQKKASFLAEATARCGLGNARVVNERIELFRERATSADGFTTVTARALSTLGDLAMSAAQILETGGRLLAMKGPNYATELPALQGSRLVLERAVDYMLPDGSRRYALELRFT